MARRRASLLTEIRRANRDLRTLQAIGRSMNPYPNGKSKLMAFTLLLIAFPLSLHNFYAGRKKLALLEVACFAISFWLIGRNIDLARIFAGAFGILLVWDLFTLDRAIDRYNLLHSRR